MKTAVIANPHSASGRTGKRWPRIERLLRERIGELDVRFTEGPGHATNLAVEVLDLGYDRIIGVGGDGTFNEIANGFVENDQPRRPSACLGILPMGTGGDLQRTLGIPPKLEDAVDLLATATPSTIDLGKVTYQTPGGERRTRYFVNVVSFGMGGEVAARAKNFFGVLGGKAAFFYATLKVFAIYRGRRVELSPDGASDTQRYKVLNVAVGNGLYHGGGMYVCPEARLDDGLLEVTVIEDLSVLTLLKDLSYLYDGNIHAHPKVRHFRAQSLTATSPETTLIEVDGEPLGSLPLEITVVPRLVDVLR